MTNVENLVLVLREKSGKIISKISSDALAFEFASGPGVLVCSKKGAVPSFTFSKELIRVGYFVDPNGTEFEITPQILEHWVDTFDVMKMMGIKVPIPSEHDGAFDPKKNNGYVRSLFVEGESLFGTLELFGKDAEELSKKTDVSIYSPSEWVDGQGNIFYRPITHVALTMFPVIPGLGEFKALAASKIPFKEKVMDLSKLKSGLGIETQITEENAVDLILSHFGKVKEDHATALSAVQDELKTVKQEKETLALSATPKKPDPTLLALSRDNRNMKLDQLVQANRLTPDAKKDLSDALTSDAALSLSLTQGDTTSFDKIVAALAKNNPVELREKTGKQILSLSQNQNESSLVADAKARADAAKK